MLGLDLEIGASALRLWIAAGSAALLIAFCGVAAFRLQSGPLARASLVILGAVFGAAMMWSFFDLSASRERSAEHRAFQQLTGELNARSLAPGSPLACLDNVAGESVDAACEKALFVSPASVASASAYIASRLSLLSAAAASVERGNADIEAALSPMRRALEADRFGFVAHVLAVRDGCTGKNCKALSLLRDPNRVRANLEAQAFERNVDRYQEAWAKAAEPNVAEASAPQAQANVPARKPVNIDFPTAASIPPVSIMNPEPTGPVLPGVAAAAAANPNPAPAAAPGARRARRQPNPPAQTAAQTPPATTGTVEPIWPEPVPPVPQPVPAPAAGAPVQLSPPQPGASAGAAARTQ